MSKRTEIIERMSKCVGELREIMVDIRAENTGDAQFDFATHPALAHNVDNLLSIANTISTIVYQEDGENESWVQSE